MDMLPSIIIMTHCIMAIYTFDRLVWNKTKHEAELARYWSSFYWGEMQFPAILTKYTWPIRDPLYGVKETFSCGINIQGHSVRF